MGGALLWTMSTGGAVSGAEVVEHIVTKSNREKTSNKLENEVVEFSVDMSESSSRVVWNGKEDPSGSQGGESVCDRGEEDMADSRTGSVEEEECGGDERLKPLDGSPAEKNRLVALQCLCICVLAVSCVWSLCASCQLLWSLCVCVCVCVCSACCDCLCVLLVGHVLLSGQLENVQKQTEC